jgi:hypothetical protein
MRSTERSRHSPRPGQPHPELVEGPGHVGHGHGLADHQQRGALQALGGDGQAGQGGQDAALVGAAGVLDDQGRGRAGAAGGRQALGDQAGGETPM